MDIKLEQNRTAQYGTALGLFLYGAWRGVARLLAVNISQRAGARRNSARLPRKTKLAAVQSLPRSHS